MTRQPAPSAATKTLYAATKTLYAATDPPSVDPQLDLSVRI